jgi:hypothetical protein
MIIFLSESNKTLLCRLSLWLHIGSVRGPFTTNGQAREMDFGCNRLELVAWDLYNQSSWRFDLRLTY